MEIVDLAETHLPTYFYCLEDWSDDIKEAGNHKEMWYEKMRDKGLHPLIKKLERKSQRR